MERWTFIRSMGAVFPQFLLEKIMQRLEHAECMRKLWPCSAFGDLPLTLMDAAENALEAVNDADPVFLQAAPSLYRIHSRKFIPVQRAYSREERTLREASEARATGISSSLRRSLSLRAKDP